MDSFKWIKSWNITQLHARNMPFFMGCFSTQKSQLLCRPYSGMMALVMVCLNTHPSFLRKLQGKPMSFVVRWLIRFKSMRFQTKIHRSTAEKMHVCRPRWTPIITFTFSYFAHVLHRENTSFEVLYLHTPVGYSRPPSAVNDPTVTKQVNSENHASNRCPNHFFIRLP